MARSAAASAPLLIPGALEMLSSRLAAADRVRADGYGPLVPDPAGLLDLPRGFHYRALSTARLGHDDDPLFSGRLSNDDLVPPLHDGMGAFAGPNGVTVLVRNHELNPDHHPILDPARQHPYDALGRAGTTTLWVDGDRQVVRAFASLSGTVRNCAGGITPWGSWLTCEECVYMPGPADPVNHDRTPDVRERHGYVFEVPAAAAGLVEPKPLRAMGRFRHEAIAVDPQSGYVYLTEDLRDGLLYRFRPDVVTRGTRHPARMTAGDLARGGTLEALRIVSAPSIDTSNAGAEPLIHPDQPVRIDWVPIADPDPDMDNERDPDDDASDPLRRRPRTAAGSTRAQGFRAGAAQFSRSEGITWHRGSAYFCCTNGGRSHDGQVWRLEPGRGTLTLLIEPNDREMLDGPDNITVAPLGDLIVCEDGDRDDRVVGITPQGRLYVLARNAYNDVEFAGACFAPDGRTLFVNIQEPGITFAIWGPWESRRV